MHSDATKTPMRRTALGLLAIALAAVATTSGCAGWEQQSDAEVARLEAWLERTHGPAAGWQKDPDDPALMHY